MFRWAAFVWVLTMLFLFGVFSAFWFDALAQEQHEEEIVANLAGGGAIVHVAKEAIIFAAIDQPVERNSIPPRLLSLDAPHLVVLFAAAARPIHHVPTPI